MCLSSSIRLAWASSHGRQRLPRAAWQGNCQILLASHWPKQITRPSSETVWQDTNQRVDGEKGEHVSYYCKQYATPCWLVSSVSLQHFLMETWANRNTYVTPPLTFSCKTQYTISTAQDFDFFHLTTNLRSIYFSILLNNCLIFLCVNVLQCFCLFACC